MIIYDSTPDSISTLRRDKECNRLYYSMFFINSRRHFSFMRNNAPILSLMCRAIIRFRYTNIVKEYFETQMLHRVQSTGVLIYFSFFGRYTTREIFIYKYCIHTVYTWYTMVYYCFVLYCLE